MACFILPRTNISASSMSESTITENGFVRTASAIRSKTVLPRYPISVSSPSRLNPSSKVIGLVPFICSARTDAIFFFPTRSGPANSSHTQPLDGSTLHCVTVVAMVEAASGCHQAFFIRPFSSLLNESVSVGSANLLFCGSDEMQPKRSLTAKSSLSFFGPRTRSVPTGLRGGSNRGCWAGCRAS
ncbi:hypothetical protein HanXRQr2_Chr10g0454021 [Helianthus annuus]|uniref:Uncharacterized protein n=1 Tax=Helianthus annuus TaxID=4232 RepID=A0A9K3HYZ3_HELAN|nr:hypothetical protein HanXRQr2_Chr10g0454021 [Helianthus annuus]